MEITYVTHTRFPVQKAHGKQIAEVCSALAALGHRVTLVCPNVSNAIRVDPFTYYDLPKNFFIRQLDHADATVQWWMPGMFHFSMNMRRYRRALARYLQEHQADLLYARLPSIAAVLTQTNIPVILELHALPKHRKRRFVRICNRCSKVVCLTKHMADELRHRGVIPSKIITEPDGVRLSRFAKLPTLKQAKQKAKNFSDDLPVIGYVGSFHTRRSIDKGIGIILDALAILRKKGVALHGLFVGGEEREIASFQHSARQKHIDHDVLFHGHLTAAAIPLQLAACDLLIYPAPATKHPYFQRDTSPLKLFEYLASGRPIICADLPPLREVVDRHTVYFFTPGDPVSLAHWIDYALKHPAEAQKKAARGCLLAEQYSWEHRMERVLL